MKLKPLTILFIGLMCSLSGVIFAQNEEESRFLEIEGLISDGINSTAISKIEAFLEDFPASLNNETLQFQLGSLQMKEDMTDKAISSFEKYLSLYPSGLNKSEVRFLLATNYGLVDRFSDAHGQLDLLLNVRDLDDQLQIAAYEKKADLYLEVADLQKAKTNLERVLDRAKSQSRLLKFADVVFELGDYRQAERSYRELVEDYSPVEPERKHIIKRLSLALYQREKYRDVVELLQPVVSRYLEDDEIVATLAWSQYKQGRYQDAFLTFNDRPVDNSEQLETAIRSGRELLMVYENSAAINFMEKLIKDNDASPQMIPAYKVLAEAYHNVGDFDKEAETKTRMIDLLTDEDDVVSTWYEIGKLFNDVVGNKAQAIRALSNAVSATSDVEKQEPILVELLKIQVEVNDLAGAGITAITFFQNYDTSKYMEEVLYYAGSIYEQAGDFDRALEHYRKIAQYHSRSPFREPSYKAALYLVYEQQHWSDVVAIGTEFLSEFPKVDGRAEILLKIAKADYELSNYLEGIERIEEAITSGDESVSMSKALLQIAWGYYKAGEFETAATYYNRVVSEFGESEEVEEALYWLGWLAQVNNDLAVANEYFNRLITTFPQSDYSEISRYQLANNYLRSNQTDRAVQTMKDILRYFPEGYYAGPVKRMLIEAQIESGNYKEAVEQLDVFVRNNPGEKVTSENLFERGNQLARAGNLSAALEEFKRIQELYPASEIADEVLFNIGNIHYKREEFRLAIREFNLLEQNFPDSDKRKPAAYICAQALMRLGRYEQAIAKFIIVTEGLEDPAGISSIHYMMGLCYERLGQPQQAIEAYRIYLEYLQDENENLRKRMEIAVLFMQNQYPDEAIEQLQRIKAAAGNDDELEMNAQYIIGQAYEEKGELATAAQEYLKVTYAHNAAPAGALMARLKAGRIYEQLNRYNDAINVYQTIVQNHGKTRFGELASIRIDAVQKLLDGAESQEPEAEQPQD